MKRCRAKGLEHFELFVGVAVLANNLMVLAAYWSNAPNAAENPSTESISISASGDTGRWPSSTTLPGDGDLH
jgi:hypothetical protein